MRTTRDDLLRPGHATDFFSRDPMPAFDPEATSTAPRTRVPPELLGYRHAGTLRLLPAAPPADRLQWLRRLLLLEPPKRFADHAPINYIRRI